MLSNNNNRLRSSKILKSTFISNILTLCLLVAGCINPRTGEQTRLAEKPLSDQKERAKILNHILKTYNSDIDIKPQEAPVWVSWLKRTGELPPDFNKLKSYAFPPDLLKFNNGSQVTDSTDWTSRKTEIKYILQKYMFGNWPPAPAKIVIKFKNTEGIDSGSYIRKDVRLFFAPSNKATEYAEKKYSFNVFDECYYTTAVLNVILYIPKGKGPFPAIIEVGLPRQNIGFQDKERIKRGYIVCRFNPKDADYFPAVYTDYECNQLEWWAYGAARCVDLLYTMDNVRKSQITTSGHSRGGKTALMAAVMDKRISATIVSHPGTGAGSFNLWRYATDKFGGETLENSTRRFPYWNNPRMRFFVGRENKMPFDNHFFLALIAPRPCLLGTGEHDAVGEVWGDQQCYTAVKKVYQLFGAEQRLGFCPSPGAHTVTHEMINDYLDWLDMQYGRIPFKFSENLVYTYSFDSWKKIAGEKMNVAKFPEKKLNDILVSYDGRKISTTDNWKIKSDSIKRTILTIIGDLPAYDKIQNINLENERTFEKDLRKAEMLVDQKLIAHLTYPATKKGKTPVVIYLHAYEDANGYNWPGYYGYDTGVGERLAQKGFLAVEFDQFGYGLRNKDCGIDFYIEHKNESALGVMIQDVRKIIDALYLVDWVDKDRIMVAGYSLGGMVGLYASAFDNRIHSVASACGFGSMRMDVHGDQTEGIKRYSHLRPTIPDLGLFLGNEKRIPYDFHEILALIAPRPVLILAPKQDQDWFHEDVEICYSEAKKVFDLYGKKEHISLISPDDFNRYPPEYQEIVDNWLSNN
jgi:cephalosporin-C deacetylase-like acetyl esterase